MDMKKHSYEFQALQRSCLPEYDLLDGWHCFFRHCLQLCQNREPRLLGLVVRGFITGPRPRYPLCPGGRQIAIKNFTDNGRPVGLRFRTWDGCRMGIERLRGTRDLAILGSHGRTACDKQDRSY